MTRVALIEWGSNEVIKEVTMEGHVPSIGDFFLDDSEVGKEGWEDRMYVVRAVTHFLDDLISLHVEKYNVNEENKKWEETAEYVKGLMRRLDNAGKKSEKDR